MAFWQAAYKYGWATKDQLKQAVALTVITAENYQSITGEVYAA